MIAVSTHRVKQGKRQVEFVVGQALRSQSERLGNRLCLNCLQRQITKCPRAALGKYLGSDLNDGVKQAAYLPCFIPDGTE